MSAPIAGFLVAVLVIVGIYFLFVLPGERKYHETKLKLMQERIERHRQSKEARDEESGQGGRSSGSA